MKTRYAPVANFVSTLTGLAVLMGAGCQLPEVTPPPALKLVADIPMAGGTNRWDYQSINYDNNRLYISHLGSSMVTVFDLKDQKVITDITDVPNPYGILVVPDLKTVYVSAGRNNQVGIIDENTLKVTKYIQAGNKPDGIAYDPNSKKVFVSNENSGTVTVIDAVKNERIEDIQVGGGVGNTHFDPVSGHIFSVSGSDNKLVEIDPATNKIVAKYDLTGCSYPHGFYIDETTHYALVACEASDNLIVFDLDSKRIVSSHTVGTNPDVLAFDPGLHRIYVAAESGILTIFHIQKGRITKLAQGFIAEKAHTVSVDKNTHKVYMPLENVNGRPVLRILEPESLAP